LVDDNSEELFFRSNAGYGEVDDNHLSLHFRRQAQVGNPQDAEELEVVVPKDLVLAEHQFLLDALHDDLFVDDRVESRVDYVLHVFEDECESAFKVVFGDFV
jgi:hypothetical protein